MKKFGDMLCGMRDVGQLLSVGILQLTIFGGDGKVQGHKKMGEIFCKILILVELSMSYYGMWKTSISLGE
jgi:hypothetical protein